MKFAATLLYQILFLYKKNKKCSKQLFNNKKVHTDQGKRQESSAMPTSFGIKITLNYASAESSEVYYP